MLRVRAVQQLLAEDVAGVSERSDASNGHTEALERARRRALTVVIVDWVAIAFLVLARVQTTEIFTFGPTEESIFSFGILAIAVHSGFRLGQLEKFNAVARAVRDLDERSGRAETASGDA